MTLFLVVSEIRGGVFKVYAKKGQQQNLRQLRLLTYVRRPNDIILLAHTSYALQKMFDIIYVTGNLHEGW